MEGIETGFSPFSWVKPCVPSINPFLSVGIGQLAGNKNHMFSASEEDLQKFMKLPNFASWFRNARLVRKVVTSANLGLRTPIKEPVEGNVVVIGDAGAPAETWIQGAVASAYMAVKAIEKELSGQKGYPKYIDWWQKAFYFHNPDYFRMAFKWMAMASTFTCDEDVDYVYKLLQDKEGVPAVLIAQNLESFKEGRPEFYERFKKVFGEVEGIVSKLGS
jgi:flavin-dependent dehydrogenase